MWGALYAASIVVLAQINAVLDLNWVHKELAPYYSRTGRPSIDPVLMIRKKAPAGAEALSCSLYNGNRPYVPKLMQLNNWVIIAAALLVLLVIARYMQHQEPPAICTDHPTAPECHR
jgi:hypothetical protein